MKTKQLLFWSSAGAVALALSTAAIFQVASAGPPSHNSGYETADYDPDDGYCADGPHGRQQASDVCDDEAYADEAGDDDDYDDYYRDYDGPRHPAFAYDDMDGPGDADDRGEGHCDCDRW